jgi:Phage major capsid protein E
MAIVRSFTNAFEVVDYTSEINLIPNKWSLTDELNIFSKEFVSQNTITFEKTAGTLALITDQVRGTRSNVNKDDNRQLHSYAIPHFPLDDYISPQDIQGKRAYGSIDTAETEAAVVARKLERIRRNHAATAEAAKMQALTVGSIYAPNGTVAANYYTDFGITRKEVDFVLSTATTNVIEKVEEVIAHITDNMLAGDFPTGGIIALCSPQFFAKLVKQANVVESFKFYTSTQEPLRNRLGNGLYRRFQYAGAEFIEYRGAFNGTALIPAGDAYFMPAGTTDTFVSYYGPANRFEQVNTIAEELYAFQFRDPKGAKIELETESNFIHMLRRPQIVVRAFSSN